MRYLIASISILLLFIPSLAYADTWYDNGVDVFTFARQLTTNATDFGSTLTNYPVYVNLTSIDLGTDAQADCDDIVFVNYYNTTKLDFEIEQCDSTNDWVEAWVRLPNAYSNGTNFFVYYGDSDSTTYEQNTQAVWNSNFKAVYHLNGTFVDSSSSPVTCTNSGTSAVTDDYIGDSRSFDVIDDYIDCPDATKTDNIFDSGGTIFAWIYPKSAGEVNLGRIYSTFDGVGGFVIDLRNPSGGSDQLNIFYDRVTTDRNAITTNREIQDNQWNFIVISASATGGSSTISETIYVDGASVAVSTSPAGVGNYVAESAQDPCIGNALADANNCNTNRTFDGYIDEIRLYDSTISTDWVSSDWECQRYDTDGCIIIGAEGTQAGGAHSGTNNDKMAQEDTVSRLVAYNRANTDEMAQSESVVAVVMSALSKTPTDEMAQSESVVAVVNSLSQSMTDDMAQSESVTGVCSGTCGVVANANAIILKVAPPTTTRLGGIFSGVCDFANNYTMIGVWPNGTIRCWQIP